MMVYTVNISDTGVFVFIEDGNIPDMDSEITMQVQGLPIEAPLVPAKVVRHDGSGGVGLMFVAN